MEASLNEALEKLDGEEHGSAVLGEKFHKAESAINELTAKGEEMSANISRVSDFVKVWILFDHVFVLRPYQMQQPLFSGLKLFNFELKFFFFFFKYYQLFRLKCKKQSLKNKSCTICVSNDIEKKM